jgi:DNA/RNA-binding domain of Phe-tRNA-synthetase-like protein
MPSQNVVVQVESHIYLQPAGFVLRHALSDGARQNLVSMLSLDDDVVERSPFDIHQDTDRYDSVKSAVRDLFRQDGFKPTGRGKPASEYLVKAVAAGKLGQISPIVDTLNAVSLHSGLPISVVDVDRLACSGENVNLRIATAGDESEYVFNVSGQTMKLDGLLCLFDDAGPCANAVKDSQRTKTSAETQASLVIIWGTNQLPGHTEKTDRWFRQLVEQQTLGQVENVVFEVEAAG